MYMYFSHETPHTVTIQGFVFISHFREYMYWQFLSFMSTDWLVVDNNKQIAKPQSNFSTCAVTYSIYLHVCQTFHSWPGLMTKMKIII